MSVLVFTLVRNVNVIVFVWMSTSTIAITMKAMDRPFSLCRVIAGFSLLTEKIIRVKRRVMKLFFSTLVMQRAFLVKDSWMASFLHSFMKKLLLYVSQL